MIFLKIKVFKIKICKNLKIGEVFRLHPKSSLKFALKFGGTFKLKITHAL